MNRLQRVIRWTRFEIIKNRERSTPLNDNGGAPVVDAGYTTRWLDVVSEEDQTSDDICREVYDILDMFRALWAAKWNGWKASDDNATRFGGFDARSDPHFRFADHLLNEVGLYPESAPNRDSRTCDTLTRYRRMLIVWRSADKPNQLSGQEAESIIAA